VNDPGLLAVALPEEGGAPSRLTIVAQRLWRVIEILGGLLAVGALVVLGHRAATVVELRWDAPMYHYPFAALRGGLGIPYVLPESLQRVYEGFPPLPHLVQGALWRITGAMSAAGAANFIALLLFLAVGQRVLRAPAWLMALGALTIPHVIIQSGSAYVDLFANVGLAIAAVVILAALVWPEDGGRSRVPVAVVGLAAAAWSKFQLAPLVGVAFVALCCLSVWRPRAGLGPRRWAATWILVGAAVASVPYGKNAVVYGNPFWPVRVPVVGERLPYTFVNADSLQRPRALAALPQPVLFAHSLFEIDHPRRYANRPRWIVDQGSAAIAFRMGGFWAVGLACSLGISLLGTLLVGGARGIRGVLAIAGMFAIVSVMPQSHELRYYLFLPLTLVAWGAMLVARLRTQRPALTLVVAMLTIGGWGYMVTENRQYYTQSRLDAFAAATAWNAPEWWALFTPGTTYCAVGVAPAGIFLTGPTMREYGITERETLAECPRGMPIAAWIGEQRLVIPAFATMRR